MCAACMDMMCAMSLARGLQSGWTEQWSWMVVLPRKVWREDKAAVRSGDSGMRSRLWISTSATDDDAGDVAALSSLRVRIVRCSPAGLRGRFRRVVMGIKLGRIS
jgi:hypothetical protein